MRSVLNNTGNFFDQVEEDSYSADLLTFGQFLQLESKFFFSDDFFQIPQYEREILDMPAIPDYACEAVRRFIFDEFENRFLGMDDYRRWGRKFRQKCEELAVPFWSQVNMQSVMRATELEMDETTSTRANTREAKSSGGQKSTTSQLNDSSSRTANRTTVEAEDIVSVEMAVDWSEAADNYAETRTKAGDMQTESNNDSVQSVTDIDTASSEYTNKQFMQERKLAIETAQGLLPKAWLRAQLAGIFFLLR